MAGSTGDGAAWVIPGAAVAIAVVGGALELGGATAYAASGNGFRLVPFEISSAVELVRHGTTSLWPSTSPVLVGVLSLLFVVAVLGPVGFFAVRAWLRRPAPDSPYRSLARVTDVRALTRFQAARRARQLRPSLSDCKPKDISPADIGIHLGNLAPANRVALYGSWEASPWR